MNTALLQMNVLSGTGLRWKRNPARSSLSICCSSGSLWSSDEYLPRAQYAQEGRKEPSPQLGELAWIGRSSRRGSEFDLYSLHLCQGLKDHPLIVFMSLRILNLEAQTEQQVWVSSFCHKVFSLNLNLKEQSRKWASLRTWPRVLQLSGKPHLSCTDTC